MKVAIYGQTYQETALDYVVEFLDELHQISAEAAIEKDFYKMLTSRRRHNDL